MYEAMVIRKYLLSTRAWEIVLGPQCSGALEQRRTLLADLLTFFGFARPLWLTHTLTHTPKNTHRVFDPSVSGKTEADVPLLTLSDVSSR